MTAASATPGSIEVVDQKPAFFSTTWGKLLIALSPFVFVQIIKRASFFPEWARLVPEGAIPNVSGWINSVTDYLKDDKILGLFNFREVTRWVTGLLDYPLDFLDGILRTGEGTLGLPLIPWILLATLFAIAGHYLSGWRLAAMAFAMISYFAVFGVWDDAMKTFAAVIVAVPVAALLGFVLGLIAAKVRWFESVLIVILNLSQAFPHFSYLLPAVVFVGLGTTAGVLDTVFFAFPPMARLTLLGIRSIPDEIIEAGEMSGATARQMTWKVELPAARRSLMMGINQVIMGCLGMVVIAAYIGTDGLGQSLRAALNSQKIGEALEAGIAVVVMAILLDRLSQAWAAKEPEHQDEEERSIWQRFRYLFIAVGATVGSLVFSRVFDAVEIFPDGRTAVDAAGKSLKNEDGTLQKVSDWTVSFAEQTDSVLDWMVGNLPVDSVRDFVLVDVLIPMKAAFVATPWVAGVALVAGIGYAVRGWRLALSSGLLLSLVAFSGFWRQAMESMYLVVAAVIICMIIGVIVGTWASKTESRVRFMQVILDTFQTMPSFVYLLPAVMLFRVSPVAVLTAMIVFPTVPAIRYTMHGLHNVPQDKVEAAKTSGATDRQLLWKVKMPLALPEMLLGLNQTLLYALFMVFIGAIIDTTDGLGRPLFLSLTNSDMGSGIIVGLCAAVIGLVVDRIIRSWASDRKEQLGLL